MVRSGAQRKTLLPAEATPASMEGPTISRKSKYRYLTSRGENFEKQLSDLLQSLSGYARRTAKLRDSGDMLAEALNGLSMAEVLNPSFKRSTSELSKAFRTIQDHRDSQVLYFEDNFLPNLAQFGESLQKQREEVKTNTSKVFEGTRRSSIWNKSSSSNSRRRSQSAERAEKPSKEEKALQQSIQRYELRRNLVLRKMLLKLILSELRFTVHSFNALTAIYKQVHQDLSPVDDLKVFNDFCHFRGLGRSALTEVEGDVSGVESNDDEDDDADDTDEEGDEERDAEDSDESGLEENNTESSGDTDRDLDLSLEPEGRRSANEEESESSKSDLVSIQSTLRRFNSTPEIPISSEEKAGSGKAKKSGKKSAKSRQNAASTEKSKINKRNNARRQGELSDAEDEAHSDANELTRSSKGKSFFK